MLETALLSSRSPARVRAVRLSLPAIVALHGAVLAGFVAASAWSTGEPPEPSPPVVFGRLAALPPPKGDGGGRTSAVPMHAVHAAAPAPPRVALPETATAAEPRGPSADAAEGGPPDGGGLGTRNGTPDGVEGGIDPTADVVGEPGADQPLSPGGDVSYPSLVHRVEPEYPRAAILTRAEGVVVLDAIITATGEVEDVRVARSANPLLDDAALRAVRQWTYRPATLNGRAVRVRLEVKVTFSLPHA